MASLDLAEYPEREGHLTAAQEAEAKEHFRAQPPSDTKVVRAWLRETFGIEYSHPGSIKLMHRLGFDLKRPEQLPKHADPAAQKDFIAKYERLVDGLPPDEKGVFVDAVHPDQPMDGSIRTTGRRSRQRRTGSA